MISDSVKAFQRLGAGLLTAPKCHLQGFTAVDVQHVGLQPY